MKWSLFTLSALLLAAPSFQDCDNSGESIDENDPAIKYTPEQMIIEQGYVPETHRVVTEDGFVLSLHRIPAARNKMPDGSKKQPFLLWHGLEGCSTNYIDQLYYESLGFILADNGYDVWIGNARGNTYSKENIHYKPNERKFWAFSWDEMAKYDLPNTIDYILEQTEYEQLYYVGHSQGTTMMFAKCSDDPDYCKKKVKAFFPLAPVARVANIKGGISMIASLTPILNDVFTAVGYLDFLSNSGIIHQVQKYFCHDDPKSDAYKVCTNLVYLLVGDKMDCNQNKTRLGVYLAHNPAGTSTQDVVHWGQGVESKQFQKYDYGGFFGLNNLFHYGRLSPPIYQVQNLNIPTYFFRGSLDTTSNMIDDKWLAGQIKDTLVCDFLFPNYTHTDFIWSKTAYKDVYPYILKNVKEIEAAQLEGRAVKCMKDS